MTLPVVVRLALVVVVVVAASTSAHQDTLVTCTSQRPVYYTVTAMQTVTKFLMRPNDPHDFGLRLQRNLLNKYMTLPPHGHPPAPAHGYLPPPAYGYLPPPVIGYLPPPAHGYLPPPPAHGYLPPPAHGYLPPRTPIPITIKPTPVVTIRPTAGNILVVPCRCNMCSRLVSEDPCECLPVFGCGGLGEVRRGVPGQ